MSPAFTADEAVALASDFEAAFRDSILGFWYPRAIDPDGGYRVCWDAAGRPDLDRRGTVSQARLVYVFARAARAGIRPDEMLAAAEHGCAYLRDTLWDHEHRGFVWTLDDHRKVTYAHAFALFGAAELARAGGSPAAADLAARTLDVLDQRMHDPRHGGYREIAAPDWSALPRRARSPIDGRRPSDKLVNTHLHVLEAMTAASRAGLGDRPLARAREARDLFLHRAKRARHGAAMTDAWSPGWRPRRGDHTVRYGHLIELAWMLFDTVGVVADGAGGDEASDTARTVRALVDEVEAHGLDPELGGLWRSGRLGHGVVDRSFEGWAQAEALLGYVWLVRVTGDPTYADRVRTLWRFVQEHLVDPAVGEWHESVDVARRGRGPKGSLWKAGYHATRALLDGAELLRDPRAVGSPP